MDEPVRSRLRPARHRGLTRPDPVTALLRPQRPPASTSPSERPGQAAEHVSGRKVMPGKPSSSLIRRLDIKISTRIYAVDRHRLRLMLELYAPQKREIGDEKTDGELPLMSSIIPRALTWMAPTVQLTRIGAGYQLFSVPLTRITSVLECAVSSVGFLWGSGAVSRSCGVSVGLAEAPDWPGRPDTGIPGYRGFRILMSAFRVTQRHRSALPTCGNSAPNADSGRLISVSFLRNSALRSTSYVRCSPTSPKVNRSLQIECGHPSARAPVD